MSTLSGSRPESTTLKETSTAYLLSMGPRECGAVRRGRQGSGACCPQPQHAGMDSQPCVVLKGRQLQMTNLEPIQARMHAPP